MSSGSISKTNPSQAYRSLTQVGQYFSAERLQWTRMLWLVNADCSTSGKGQACKLPPTLLTHLRDLHVLRCEICQGRRKVVAHEEKLVLVVLLGIMKRGLKRRHGENQPAATSINAGKMEHIAKEGPVSLGVLG
jgi:hypothetical protein